MRIGLLILFLGWPMRGRPKKPSAGFRCTNFSRFQVSTPPHKHQCTELFSVAKKPKENNKGDGPFLSATTSAHKLPSAILTKTDGLGARRALFASKKEAMDRLI